MQGGIERALFHLQNLFGIALDLFDDGVTVRWAGKERPQNEEVQSALQKVDAITPLMRGHST
jgi:hypothetical protein